VKLELQRYKVRDAVFGSSSALADGVLTIKREEMRALLNRDGFFESVCVDIAKPGDAVRIIHIMDAVEPRLKIEGAASPFPGMLGGVEMAGSGRTNVLDGVAVLQTGAMKGIQEGLIDMSGPGAAYSIFSRTINVVLTCTPPADCSSIDFDRATRKAGLEAAVYLAGVTKDLVPDEIEVFDSAPLTMSDRSLPRVAYICHLQSQGTLRDTYVYGENVRALLPTLLHPNEVLDGAIVSSNYIIACQKNPTYLHCNNPVVRELYARHNHDLVFAGVIIANEFNTLKEKERSAKFAAKLAAQLGVQGVVISQEGGGHADTDLMLCACECEKLGIRATILLNEIAGADGDQPSLVDTSSFADAVVTTGNNDDVVALPAMDRAIGGDEIAGVPVKPAEAFKTPLGRIYTATCQFGATAMTVQEY
jgi:glycine reductase